MRLQFLGGWAALACAAARAATTGGKQRAAAVARQSSSSFSLLEDESPFTFEYSTSAPDASNWIGVYNADGGGPDDEEYVEDALAWSYAPDESGTVLVSTASLDPGSYKAYFLATDGYEWLAEPLEVTLPEGSQDFEFIVSNITLQNARVGDEFEASIGGLLSGSGGSSVEYTIVSGANNDGAWAEISSDGDITGTPSGASGTAQIVVRATSSGGDEAELDVFIPVRAEGDALVSELNIMTYNLWHGGTRVQDYHRKQVRFLAASNADIVGVQESTPDHATRLGEALGWHVWQDSGVGVISRYPIAEIYPRVGSFAGSVRISIDGECEQLNLWNAHLGYNPYGPYDFCFDQMTWDEVREREAESGRTPQIIETVEAMEDQLADSDDVPVVLLGDFNAPSHLDWVEELREKNCGYADIQWPTSKHPTDAGLVDSFREAHPNPVANEGITWSPIFLENDGRPEPLDRIDFIYHKSDYEVLRSETIVVGNPTPQPNQENNEWTSDHAAVMTTFKLSGNRC